MQTIRISIALDYDLESHYNSPEEYKNLSLDSIVDDLEDNVYEDLLDLMRGDRLKYWSESRVVA
jgi:hypothetical protein